MLSLNFIWIKTMIHCFIFFHKIKWDFHIFMNYFFEIREKMYKFTWPSAGFLYHREFAKKQLCEFPKINFKPSSILHPVNKTITNRSAPSCLDQVFTLEILQRTRFPAIKIENRVQWNLFFIICSASNNQQNLNSPKNRCVSKQRGPGGGKNY